MNAVLETVSPFTAKYDAIREHLPGQQLAWLQQQREAALAQFNQNGFPTLRDEEWKYTNVSAINKKAFNPVLLSELDTRQDSGCADMAIPDCWQVVLVDGHFSAAQSNLQNVPEGVFIGSLAEALDQHPELVEAYFGRALEQQNHGFIDLNNAWFSDGLFVHVPAKTILTQPIQFIHQVNSPDALVTTRQIIALEAHAEAKVIECFQGNPEHAYLTTSVTEVIVAENAGLSLSKLQSEADKAFHFGGVYVKQAPNSRFKHFGYSFGGLLTRNELITDLQQASECELNGLYIGVKKQHIDNHTRINHVEPHAISREGYKGVLDQRARGVFQGRVVVFEDAQKTDSEMNNRNLLLSEHAEADSKPQLEIYADDVKCAHGVTTGQLDDKSVFYLQSRCIDETTARNMLTFAFANEMVEKLDFDAFKKQVLMQLLAHFPQSGIVKEWL